MSEPAWVCPGCDTEYDRQPIFDLGGVCGACYEEDEEKREASNAVIT